MHRPARPSGGIIARQTRYPDLTGQRRGEGGRRLRGLGPQRRPDQPLVSVITVCRNAADTLEQTITSVRAQSWGSLEHVIIDAASDDATLPLLTRHDGQIDYYLSEPDAGLYHAMNKGLELVSGEFVLILNADDWYEPDTVESLVAAWQASGADFVSALARYIDPATGAEHVLRAMPYDASAYLRMPLRHETMLIPTSLYQRLGGYDATYRIIADRDYTARLYAAGASHHQLERPLLNFRTSGLSNSQPAQIIAERQALLAAHFPFLTSDDCRRLTDPGQNRPETFAALANAHPDQPDFAAACRALLIDRRRHGSPIWHSDAAEMIKVAGPKTGPETGLRAKLAVLLSRVFQRRPRG